MFFSVTLQALEVLEVCEGSMSCTEQYDEDVYPFENEAGSVLHVGLGNCRVGLKDRKVDKAYWRIYSIQISSWYNGHTWNILFGFAKEASWQIDSYVLPADPTCFCHPSPKEAVSIFHARWTTGICSVLALVGARYSNVQLEPESP